MIPARSNPFCGLRPFDLEDAPFFFGRNEAVDELLDRLDDRRVVALIGAPGSGKSSLVRAGALSTILESPAACRIVVLRPGSDPVGNLADALRNARIPASDEALRRSSFGIVEAVGTADATRERVVIVIDQFEELFRLHRYSGRSDDADFFATLLASAIRSNTSINVLITLRADFIADVTRLPALPEALSQALMLIHRLNRVELTEAIERPIEYMGAAIDRACVQRILNDVNDVGHPLPQLQHVLMEMWEYWQVRHTSQPIGLRDYEAVGTITAALDLHGDRLLNASTEGEPRLIERIFGSLSTEEGGRVYRRPARIHEIAAAAGSTPEKVARTADPFIAAGFLVGSAMSVDSILDLGHEVLLSGWTRLAAWSREEIEVRNKYLSLVNLATDYNQSRSELLRGVDLAQAVNWLEGWKPNAAWGARYSDSDSFEQVLDYIRQSQAYAMRDKRRSRRRTLLLQVTLALVGLLVTIFAWMLGSLRTR